MKHYGFRYGSSLSVALLWFALSQHSTKALGQDIHFSQFYETSILRNPALTGIFSGDYKAGVNYRSQWGNISVPFQTVMGSAELRIPVNVDAGDYLSVGLATTFDKAGTISFNSLQVFPALNYNKAIEDAHQSYLSAGFTAGYVQRSIDPSKVTTSEQLLTGIYNGGIATGENFTANKLTYVDVGAGLSFNSSIGPENNVNYYLGVSSFHINRPRQTFNKNDAFLRTNMKWNGNAGFQTRFDSRLGMTLHGNYSRQGPYTETLVGGLVSFRTYDANVNTSFTLYLGAFYRFGDAVIPTVKLDYRTCSFTLSYDVTLTKLTQTLGNTGGVEVSVFVRNKLSNGLWKNNNTRCPRFELLMPGF
jgi:type IX secretion system PorP/SprF family membrane protein